MRKLKKLINGLSEKVNPKLLMVFATINFYLTCGITTANAAGANTDTIDAFIDFACEWLQKIGGVVALVGAVMFALGWQREDAEGKSRGLMTVMAGMMIVAIASAKSLFGL